MRHLPRVQNTPKGVAHRDLEEWKNGALEQGEGVWAELDLLLAGSGLRESFSVSSSRCEPEVVLFWLGPNKILKVVQVYAATTTSDESELKSSLLNSTQLSPSNLDIRS